MPGWRTTFGKYLDLEDHLVRSDSLNTGCNTYFDLEYFTSPDLSTPTQFFIYHLETIYERRSKKPDPKESHSGSSEVSYLPRNKSLWCYQFDCQSGTLERLSHYLKGDFSEKEVEFKGNPEECVPGAASEIRVDTAYRIGRLLREKIERMIVASPQPSIRVQDKYRKFVRALRNITAREL